MEPIKHRTKTPRSQCGPAIISRVPDQ
ncbi:hypothetical protein [Streptomyces collinus]